jgi:hypothetical protein
MLDRAGAVRSPDANNLELLKQQWKASDVQRFDNASQLSAWQATWPEGAQFAAKVVYDRAAGEIRVALRVAGNAQQRTFVVDRDLASALIEANNFIREEARKAKP